MALLGFFKKPQKDKKPIPVSRAVKGTKKERSRKPEIEGVKKEEPKHETRKEKGAPVALKESRTAWRVLRKPHVTEKATAGTQFNQYIFRLLGNPSKPEVKRSIEEIYNVHVERVGKISVPGKQRRRGRHKGWKPGYKKAIVTLKEGDKIEVLPH